MTALSDVARVMRPPSRVVHFADGAGGSVSVELRGVTASQMAEIGERYPAFMEMMEKTRLMREATDGDPAAIEKVNRDVGEEMFKVGVHAIPALIASGAGEHGNADAEAEAASFSTAAQGHLLGIILSLTNPAIEEIDDPRTKPLSPLGGSSPQNSALGERAAE